MVVVVVVIFVVAAAVVVVIPVIPCYFCFDIQNSYNGALNAFFEIHISESFQLTGNSSNGLL